MTCAFYWTLHNAVVCWFGEYRPSTMLKCILLKYFFFTNKSMQYLRHTLLVVATHCDCSIGRHLDGVVCHYNMIYFSTWMQLRFHIRTRVDGGGTTVYVFTQTSRTNKTFKKNGIFAI